MSTEKMREDFELAWSLAMSDDQGVPGHKPKRSSLAPETYAGGAAEFAWKWWQRSRAAIEVVLPAACSFFTDDPERQAAELYEDIARESIIEQGLRVKP